MLRRPRGPVLHGGMGRPLRTLLHSVIASTIVVVTNPDSRTHAHGKGFYWFTRLHHNPWIIDKAGRTVTQCTGRNSPSSNLCHQLMVSQLDLYTFEHRWTSSTHLILANRRSANDLLWLLIVNSPTSISECYPQGSYCGSRLRMEYGAGLCRFTGYGVERVPYTHFNRSI